MHRITTMHSHILNLALSEACENSEVKYSVHAYPGYTLQIQTTMTRALYRRNEHPGEAGMFEGSGCWKG